MSAYTEEYLKNKLTESLKATHVVSETKINEIFNAKKSPRDKYRRRDGGKRGPFSWYYAEQ